MRRWNLDVASCGFDDRFEKLIAELGLEYHRTILKSLPSNAHWHIRKKGSKGTLEATWLIEAEEAWVSLRANREAIWAADAAESIVIRFRDPPSAPSRGC
jgi:hypothetical protein